jgi:uncharacterized protein YqeY
MLFEQINTDLKNAMKAGDKQTVSCLRMLVAAIKNKEISLRKTLEEQEIVSVVHSVINQHKDSYEQFKKGSREDLAIIEEHSINVLKNYLPQELTDSEIQAIVNEVIAETNATKKDFGMVMKTVMSKVAGKADGKRINSIVSQSLKA